MIHEVVVYHFALFSVTMCCFLGKYPLLEENASILIKLDYFAGQVLKDAPFFSFSGSAFAVLLFT
jgi:hypothetical protein